MIVLGACVLAPPLAAGSFQEPEVNLPAGSSQEPEAVPTTENSVLQGVFTRRQASRGEQRFEQVCAACHRTNEFSGSLFRATWVSQTVGDLFDLISTTMPEGKPGSLRPEEYADILAFILGSNDYPTGDEDLPADRFRLETIRIESP